MSNNLTPYDDRDCPVYGRIVDGELCYETALCLAGFFKVSSVSEMQEVKDVENARRVCAECPHSKME